MSINDPTPKELDMENRILRKMMEMVKSSNGTFNGLPGWVRAIGVIGFPAFIALYFLARDAGYVPSVFTSTSSQMTAVQKSMEQQRERLENNTRVLTTGLRVLCLNDAGTDARKVNRCQEIQ